MKPKVIIILILLVLSLIFVIQNTTIVEVQLFFWKISMARIIMLSFLLLVGFIIGYLVAKFSEERKPAK
ncbi:MAG: LapA family protein [Candidatus Aminicenantes bacterium]|nr:LapA family protein [Candidatus Aminicenantes bacterium]MDH5468431.1 LapA family protein [Candidatus Aminicenantes bacterium]